MKKLNLDNVKEYFVSHDSPTCVRNLLEGQDIILFAGKEIAVKIELGESTPPPNERINDCFNYIDAVNFEEKIQQIDTQLKLKNHRQ